MTSGNKKTKKLARARATLTGESYVTSLRHVSRRSRRLPLSEIVAKTIEIAEARHKEEMAIESSDDSPFIDVGSAPSRGPGGRRGFGASLEAFLRERSFQELLALQTIYYLGRGDDHDVLRLHRYLLSVTPDKEDAAETLAGKLPLHECLRAGMHCVGASGFEIERLLNLNC